MEEPGLLKPSMLRAKAGGATYRMPYKWGKGAVCVCVCVVFQCTHVFPTPELNLPPCLLTPRFLFELIGIAPPYFLLSLHTYSCAMKSCGNAACPA